MLRTAALKALRVLPTQPNIKALPRLFKALLAPAEGLGKAQGSGEQAQLLDK